MFDWKFKTTFMKDFSIADIYWKKAIIDTYKRAFEEWKDNYVYLTELVIVLNWKIRQHYDKWNEELASVYNDLWWEADLYAQENLKWEEAKYFFTQTD